MAGADVTSAAAGRSVRAASTPSLLDNPPIPVRAKLATAWTSFMFLYIYVDHFRLYKAGRHRRNPGWRRL